MRKIALQIGLVVASVGPAAAADLYPEDNVPAVTEPGGFEARWNFTGSAYLWAPSLSGTVGLGGLPPLDIDVSFRDIVDNLDFAFMAIGEARYGRFGIATDLMYTKLSGDGTGPLGLLDASLTNQIIVGTLMGEYRVIEQGKSSLDVMAGARVWGVMGDFDVTLNGGEPGPGTGASGSGEKYWVDPMIGVKSRLQGASPWYLTGWAMVGGFGVSSDIDWDLFGGVGYQFVAGYRAVGVDYQDGDFLFDVIQQGPIMGGVFRF